MSDSDYCEHCKAEWDEHNYEHLARECYPKQIGKLKAMLAQPPTRTWTSARPTKPGMYWNKDGGEVRALILDYGSWNRLEVNCTGDNELENYTGLWLGPIEPPLDSPPQE